MPAKEWAEGVAGTDEAGRGPLAGPVVAAAVLLPPGFDLTGLDDSKRLTPDRRTRQAERIRAGAVWAVETVEPDEIDRVNILRASLAAMARAVARLEPRPLAVIVDGDRAPPVVGVEVRLEAKADGRYAAVAAASILAKVARDEIMVALDARHPGYGFARNFGYPTPDHLEALRRHGPCIEHRRTFEPVRTLLEQQCLTFDD